MSEFGIETSVGDQESFFELKFGDSSIMRGVEEAYRSGRQVRFVITRGLDILLSGDQDKDHAEILKDYGLEGGYIINSGYVRNKTGGFEFIHYQAETTESSAADRVIINFLRTIK